MFHIFKTPQVIDSATEEHIWLFFEWAMDHFDISYFSQHTRLVEPNDRFFPDKASDEMDMARAITRRVADYSGLSAWPFTVVASAQFYGESPPLLQLNWQTRGVHSTNISVQTEASAPLQLSYASEMMKQPMDLIANFSKLISQHFLWQSQLSPPLGQESFNETSELISVYMGFGIMLANSAYTYRGSCARCVDPRAIRQAALHENDLVYALALFCTLKSLPKNQTLPHLKPYLRPLYKRAEKQVLSNKERLQNMIKKIQQQ